MAVDAHIIKHPQYEVAYEKITRCLESGQKGRKPKNLKLFGVSGVGKTTLLQAFKNAHPRYETQEKTVVPVLLADIPSKPSLGAIFGGMLKSLGDPFPYHENPNKQQDKLITLVNACCVELIILDEMQHFLDRGKLKTHAASADALKVLIDKLQRPAVFAGAPRCDELFRVNKQLRGRFKPRVALPPFSIFSSSAAEEFRRMAKSLMKKSGFVNIDFFDDEQSLRRLFYATDGILRDIVDLLSEAFDEAERLNVSILSMELLKNTFQTWLDDLSDETGNPFNKNFKERRLTLPGEIHEPSKMDGDNHGWSKVDI